MAPAGRRAADRRKEMTVAETRIKKISMKRPALQWGRNWQPAMFLFSKFARFSGLRAALLRRRSTSNKEQQGNEVVVVKEAEPIEDLKKKQPYKMGINSIRAMAYWIGPGQDNCCICGDNEHDQHFCPFNYIYGLYNPFTCRAECPPGQHTITSKDHSKFLRCLVRVNNLPATFKACELATLFKPFGQLLMWDAPLSDAPRRDASRISSACRGYGVVAFKNREDGESHR